MSTELHLTRSGAGGAHSSRAVALSKRLLVGSAVALTIGGSVPLGMSPAGAAPAAAATATAYGANASLAGTPVVNKAGLATATLPPGEDDGPNALVLVPAEPVAVSGTAVGVANAHVASDIPSSLEQVAQAVPGPYNARGAGLIEDLDVLLGVAPVPGTPDLRQSVVSASLVRGEAVGCLLYTSPSPRDS